MAQDRIYLTVGAAPNQPDKVFAIITIGTPQRGDEGVEVLTLEIFPKETTRAEIQAWFDRMMVEQPWNTRQ